MTFSFVAMRTNLIPSFRLTQLEDGMESTDSELISLSSNYPEPSIMWEKGMEPYPDVALQYVHTIVCVPERRTRVCVCKSHAWDKF